MRAGIRVSFAAAMLAGALAGLSGSAWSADQAADVETLTKLSDAWDAAIVRKDERAIADNMADDFRQIDGSGNYETKQSFVAGIMDPKLTIDPYTVEDFEVRIFGDTALLYGRSRMTGKHDGKPFVSNYRYIDIYVRRSGVWKIVSVQITRLEPTAT